MIKFVSHWKRLFPESVTEGPKEENRSIYINYDQMYRFCKIQLCCKEVVKFPQKSFKVPQLKNTEM